MVEPTKQVTRQRISPEQARAERRERIRKRDIEKLTPKLKKIREDIKRRASKAREQDPARAALLEQKAQEFASTGTIATTGKQVPRSERLTARESRFVAIRGLIIRQEQIPVRDQQRAAKSTRALIKDVERSKTLGEARQIILQEARVRGEVLPAKLQIRFIDREGQIQRVGDADVDAIRRRDDRRRGAVGADVLGAPERDLVAVKGRIEKAPKEKRISGRLRKRAEELEFEAQFRTETPVERQFKGLQASGVAFSASVAGFVEQPITTAKGIVRSIIDPIGTIKGIGTGLRERPAQTVGELGAGFLLGKGISKGVSRVLPPKAPKLISQEIITQRFITPRTIRDISQIRIVAKTRFRTIGIKGVGTQLFTKVKPGEFSLIGEVKLKAPGLKTTALIGGKAVKVKGGFDVVSLAKLQQKGRAPTFIKEFTKTAELIKDPQQKFRTLTRAAQIPKGKPITEPLKARFGAAVTQEVFIEDIFRPGRSIFRKQVVTELGKPILEQILETRAVELAPKEVAKAIEFPRPLDLSRTFAARQAAAPRGARAPPAQRVIRAPTQLLAPPAPTQTIIQNIIKQQAKQITRQRAATISPVLISPRAARQAQRQRAVVLPAFEPSPQKTVLQNLSETILRDRQRVLTIPGVRQIPLTETIPRQRAAVRARPITRAIPRALQKAATTPLLLGSIFGSAIAQRQVQAVRARPVTRALPKTLAVLPALPPAIPALIPPDLPFFLPISKRRKKKEKRRRRAIPPFGLEQKFGLRPSLIAQVFDLKLGVTPKQLKRLRKATFTGLEIIPKLIVRRKKKKSKKKKR